MNISDISTSIYDFLSGITRTQIMIAGVIWAAAIIVLVVVRTVKKS